MAKTLDEKVSRFLQVILDVCAYAGTGDVLKASTPRPAFEPRTGCREGQGRSATHGGTGRACSLPACCRGGTASGAGRCLLHRPGLGPWLDLPSVATLAPLCCCSRPSWAPFPCPAFTCPHPPSPPCFPSPPRPPGPMPLQVQQLLAICGEHIEVEEGTAWKAAHQPVAVLGLGLLAMSEELGGQMSHRALEHLLQYGEPAARWAGRGAGRRRLCVCVCVCMGVVVACTCVRVWVAECAHGCAWRWRGWG